MRKDGKQEATVTINQGYHPDTVVAKKGIPLVLRFDLQEKSCTGTVIFNDFNIEKKLTQFKITSVEFLPDTSGTFIFSCPMYMVKGALVVGDNTNKIGNSRKTQQ